MKTKKRTSGFTPPPSGTHTGNGARSGEAEQPEQEAQPPETILERLAKVRFDASNPPPDDPVVFSVGGVEVCHPGNITVIEAHQKAGKSAYVSAGMASTFAAPGADCLGWSSDGNPQGLAVLHFDCEQSRGDHHRLVARAVARAGTDAPPWLVSYCITGWSCEDMRAAIIEAVKEATRIFGGVHSLWLDGVADPVNSPNDEAECFGFVRWLQMFAIDHRFPVVGILHLNPGDTGKSRGHLGSQLNRKAETVLRVTKDADEVSIVTSQWSRRAPIPRDATPCFAWCNETGRHVTVASKGEADRDAKLERLRELAVEVFRDDGGVGLTWEQLHVQIGAKEGVQRGTARHRFAAMMKGKIVRKSGEKYRLA